MNLLPFYRALADGYKGSMTAELNVLLYNGDTDPCINSYNTQKWTAAVGQPETEAWRPWTIDGKARMGGYVTRYATDGAGSFDFLTIRGSGHMVPEYEPRSAKTMLEYWLSGEPWPYYLP
jgi:serine carboxypeptidase-like clade I